MEPVMEQHKACFACLSNFEKGFSILSTDHEFSIADLLEKHFWFKREDFQPEQTLCISCWNQLDSFHRFYLIVERNYSENCIIEQEGEILALQDNDQLVHSPVEIKSEPLDLDDLLVSPNSCNDESRREDFSEDDLPLEALQKQKQKYTKRKKISKKAEWAIKEEIVKTHVQLKCEQCVSIFPTLAAFQKHMLEVHDMPKAPIFCCGKRFTRIGYLVKHVQQEQNPNKFQCDICQTWFKNERNWLRHYRAHKQLPVTCDICGHVAPNKKAWRAHDQRVHAETKPAFVCDECGKEFRRAANLKYHMISHTGERVVCSFCPRTFETNAIMLAHRKKLHPEEWLNMKNSQHAT